MQITRPEWQKKFLILFLLGMIAYILQAPIDSDSIPIGDFFSHVVILANAKSSLLHHQWPPKIIYNEHGFGIPYFQFYGIFTSSLGAIILKYFKLTPWSVYKILVWLSVFISGIYIYRIVNWLVHSRKIAFLSAVVYQCAPYFIINTMVRGDLTESFAQGLVPVALYYSLQLFFLPTNGRNFLLLMLSWFTILTSSIIVYVYSAIFIGVFFLFYSRLNKDFFNKIFLLGAAHLLSIFLSAWYIIPILVFNQNLLISLHLPNPQASNYLTHLNSLLSLYPENLSADIRLLSPILPAVGWPILLGVGACVYILVTKKRGPPENEAFLVKRLIFLFFISLFLTYSPIDIWGFLPKKIWLEQFTYRMLTQIMWIGAICFGLALHWIYTSKIKTISFIICFYLICLTTHSWLPLYKYSLPTNKLNLKAVTHTSAGIPSFSNYITRIDSVPLYNDFDSSLLAKKICDQIGNKIICNFTVKNPAYYQLPIFYYPNMFRLKVNNLITPYVATPYIIKPTMLPTVFSAIYLKPGVYKVESEFTGLIWANRISLFTWILLLTSFLLYLLSSSNLMRKWSQPLGEIKCNS